MTGRERGSFTSLATLTPLKAVLSNLEYMNPLEYQQDLQGYLKKKGQVYVRKPCGAGKKAAQG